MQSSFCLYEQQIQETKMISLKNLVPRYISSLLFPVVLQKRFQKCHRLTPPPKKKISVVIWSNLQLQIIESILADLSRTEFTKTAFENRMSNANMQPAKACSCTMSMARRTPVSVSQTVMCTQISWDLVNTHSDSIGLGCGPSFCLAH